MIETTSLYNGEIVCEFDPVRHSYTIVNKGRRYKVPSVTRITSVLDKSGPLVNWAINNTLEVCKGAIAPGTEYAEAYLDAVWQAAKDASKTLKGDAAKRGKGVHQAIEDSLKGRETGTEAPFQGAVDWLASTKLETRDDLLERRIYSRRWRYSGTLDLLAIDPASGGLVLVDWKTSKSIYPEYRLQTAAYVAAYEEEFPDQKIEGRYLVKIDSEGNIEPHFFGRRTLKGDIQAFHGALKLFNRVQQIEKEARKLLKTKEK